MHRIKKLSIQITKYFGAALVGYIFDFGTLIILTEYFRINYLVAASIGFSLGLIIVYILCNKFVFGESKLESKIHEFVFFAVIGLAGLLILTGLMWFFTDWVKINYIVSKIIATIFVYIWNFFARRNLYHD